MNFVPKFCWNWGYLSKDEIFQHLDSFSSLFSFPNLDFGLFLLSDKELMWVFPFYLSCLMVNKTSFPPSLPSVKYSVWNLGLFLGGILGGNVSDDIREPVAGVEMDLSNFVLLWKWNLRKIPAVKMLKCSILVLFEEFLAEKLVLIFFFFFLVYLDRNFLLGWGRILGILACTAGVDVLLG